MDAKLLDMLCCPVSKTPLRQLQRPELKRLNKAIDTGKVLTVAGETVRAGLDDGLITTDAKVIYPVEDGIPVLLGEAGIGTTQLDGLAS